MKCTIPEISWHNRDPVCSLDIQPSSQNDMYRMATAGTDAHIVIWQLRVLDNGGVSVEALSDLTRHNRAVNAVRFSPDGEHLASADDEAAIILWKKDDSSDIFMDESEKDNKEHWTIWKMLRGHLEDVYDLCWSPCSQFIFTGAVDNTAILWNVAKGKSMSILSDHKGFVQGVAWDPLGQYVATLCSDRCCRIFSFETKKIAHKIYKATLPVLHEEDKITEKTTKLFYDDTLKSFCRRLNFSPDGELLLTPSGIVEEENGKVTNVTYVFSRHNLAKPVLYLPTKDKFTLAVRFCPVLFELKPLPQEEGSQQETSEPREPWEEHANLFHLPYRMVFAVATQNAILLYDTQQPVPFAKLSNIHYTRLSDLSWSSDGRLLVASSTDGYCSLVSFVKGELGTPYVGKKNRDPEKHESVMGNSNKVAEHESPEDVEMEDVSKAPATAILEESAKCEEDNKSLSGSTLIEASRNQDVEESPSSKVPEELCKKQDEEGNKLSTDVPEEPSKKQEQDEECSKPSSSIAETTTEKQQEESKEPSSDMPQEPPKKQITVRRAGDSSKSTKRISLITLSGPSLKNDENTPVPKAEATTHTASTSAENQEKDVDEEVKKRFEGESVTPSKAHKDLSPSKTPSGKTPRRVPLITLASPKGKKSSSECR